MGDSYRPKGDLSIFTGDAGIEDFLDWIGEIESFFSYMRVAPERKVDTVAHVAVLNHGGGGSKLNDDNKAYHRSNGGIS